jgi:hypothetical protein
MGVQSVTGRHGGLEPPKTYNSKRRSTDSFGRREYSLGGSSCVDRDSIRTGGLSDCICHQPSRLQGTNYELTCCCASLCAILRGDDFSDCQSIYWTDQLNPSNPQSRTDYL